MKKMVLEQTEELKQFLKKCEEELFNAERKKEIIYSPKLDLSEIKNTNKELFDTIGKEKPNIYVIFAANNKDSDFCLKYIGQTNSKGARTRLTNHLIKKHERTGAKLKEVDRVVKNGGRIKISFISIEPESLRHYIEEELINKYEKELEWNRHGKKPHQKNS